MYKINKTFLKYYFVEWKHKYTQPYKILQLFVALEMYETQTKRYKTLKTSLIFYTGNLKHVYLHVAMNQVKCSYSTLIL